MDRPLRLVQRAWRLRHDREALVSGLDRLGVRVPGAGSYRHRSPRVGVLVDRARAGHVQRSLDELERLAADPGRLGIDATLALADWHVMHGAPERTVQLLAPLARRSTEAIGLALEGLGASGGRSAADSFALTAGERGRARRHPHVRWLLAGLSTDPLALWNETLRRHRLAPVESADHTIASLTCTPATTFRGPLVTVIVPAHDASGTIGYALRSVLNQSWRDLDVIVVDDASTDSTSDIVRSIVEHDDRVHLVTLTENQGAYGARNHGLSLARGEYVTVHDADDWAHPERIRLHVEDLRADRSHVGNLTSLVRARPDLTVTRRGFVTNQVVGFNHSSLMFPRAIVDEIGAWDDVRVGADSEFIERIERRYGPRSIRRIMPRVPLAVAANTPTSLVTSGATGLDSTLLSTGARNYYHLAARSWHASDHFVSDLPLRRTSDSRPFAAPALMRGRDATQQFDVVLMSDLALPGGTTASNLTEIAAQERFGYSTGLLHNRNPLYRDTGPQPKFFDAISDRTRLLSAGETVSCSALVVKYPPTAVEIPDVFPRVDVQGRVAAVINQTPFTGYSGERHLVYDLLHCDREITRTFGRRPLWFCSGPAVRQVLQEHHEADLQKIDLSPEDWPEIIDVAAWKRPIVAREPGPIRIGRHGRDDEWKWPARRADILAAYPADRRFEIRVLGGADVARRRLGSLPSNWKVLPFDAVSPQAWLAELDVFVYFPHPDMVEAFGRTILEALAVGVPVVCDARFAPVFGDAVISCSLHDASTWVDRLMGDDAFHRRQVEAGLELVESTFSFAAHRQRLERLVR